MFDFDDIEDAQEKYLASKVASVEAHAAGAAMPAKVWTPWAETQAAEKVTVWLDPQSPDLAITLQVPTGGATVRWLREELCKQDPTGELAFESIRLGMASARGATSPLADDAALTAALSDLVILDEEEASTAGLQPDGVPDAPSHPDGPEEGEKTPPAPEHAHGSSQSREADSSGVGRREGLGGQRPLRHPAATGVVSSANASAVTPPAGRLAELSRVLAAAEEAGRADAILEALLARAEFHRQQGEAAAALVDAERCVDLSDADARAIFLCGKARLEAGGRTREALGELRRARRLDPSLPGFDAWILRAEHWGSVGSHPNHYRALGLPADATAEAVRRAHRRMALIWHPDKPTGDAAKFRAVQEAWEVLGDEKRKVDYDFGGRKPAPDRLREPPPRQSSQGGAYAQWPSAAGRGRHRADRSPAAGSGPPGPGSPEGEEDADFWHWEFGSSGATFEGSAAAARAGFAESWGSGGPSWVWTAAGIRACTRHADEFGHPREGDTFTPEHLATAQKLLKTDRGGYGRLSHEGFIRRAGKGFNSLDPPPRGYHSEVYEGMRNWPGLRRGPNVGGGRGGPGGHSGPGRGPPPPRAEPQEETAAPVGDGIRTCLYCGAPGGSSREKGQHERESGHMGGFFMGG